MPGEVGLRLVSRSPAETMEVARRLGAALDGGETIALVGDLGSGKTTFTKGLSIGLGLRDARVVSSPTYVLEHLYEARVPIRHYDAYRLASAEEFLALGFREHLGGRSVLVIEWAEKVLPVLPGERLLVGLSFPPGGGAADHRTIRLSGPHDLWASKLDLVAGASS